jgi:hypothetical protein
MFYSVAMLEIEVGAKSGSFGESVNILDTSLDISEMLIIYLNHST